MFKYLIDNRTPELRNLVVEYGVTPAKDPKDLWLKLNYVAKTFPKQVFPRLAEIHPDRDLILSVAGLNNSAEDKSGACGCSGADGYSNCAGCGGTCGGKKEYSNCAGNPDCNCDKGYSGAGGDSEKVATTPSADNTKHKTFTEVVSDNLPVIVIGGLVLAAGLVLLGRSTK